MYSFLWAKSLLHGLKENFLTALKDAGRAGTLELK